MKRAILGLLLCTSLLGVFTIPRIALADDDDPAAYFDDQCLDCHHRKKKPIEDKHLSREEWQKAIDKMIDLEKLDPVPSKAFVAKMVDWLTATHGPSGASAAAAPANPDAAKKTE